MITSWQLYGLTRLDRVGCFFNVCAAMGLTMSVISFFALFVFPDDLKYQPQKFKWIWKLWAVTALVSILSGLTPTTHEMAAILVIPKIANNQKVKELPDKILTLADEWLEALKPKSK